MSFWRPCIRDGGGNAPRGCYGGELIVPKQTWVMPGPLHHRKKAAAARIDPEPIRNQPGIEPESTQDHLRGSPKESPGGPLGDPLGESPVRPTGHGGFGRMGVLTSHPGYPRGPPWGTSQGFPQGPPEAAIMLYSQNSCDRTLHF